MGWGKWTCESFANYSEKAGRTLDDSGNVTGTCGVQEMFKCRSLHAKLNPKNVIRECCDSEEHPNSVPVILALDVTGSMGSAAMNVAKKLNEIMTELYNKVQDVEFMIMAIGDLDYDGAPIQISQFESDIRIAEQLDQVYFEGGGGGNGFESYTAAWYMGCRHTRLDCWKRGKKGLIITMGDEPLNPYLPKERLSDVTGDDLKKDIETKDIYQEVLTKFDVYHLSVDDSSSCYRYYAERISESYSKYLDSEHMLTVTLDSLAKTIVEIVSKHAIGCCQDTISWDTSAKPGDTNNAINGAVKNDISW